MSTFTGFSDEDLQRIKSGGTRPNNAQPQLPPLFDENPANIKTATFGHAKNRQFQLKNITVRKQISDDPIDEMVFEKCRLSLRSPTTPNSIINNNNDMDNKDQNDMLSNRETNDKLRHDDQNDIMVIEPTENGDISDSSEETVIEDVFRSDIIRKDSVVTPDIVRGVDMTEDELASHRAKLEELQLKQKLMEEQNKKRKEMLSKALADRTRQTEEEVMKLEKIKKELQVLDGQFSQDVNVLRKKIDQACLTYSEAEKNYLKVEKEFLQAKIHLQKEKEKKELLTEHLCALITHNETRKAQKLETLMLELASNKKLDINEVNVNNNEKVDDDKDEVPIIVDGVDERTGKIVEMSADS